MNALIMLREAGQSACLPPRIEIAPGSAITMPGRGPLFLPRWSRGGMTLQGAVALRLSRLGKCIERSFASRYYDAVAGAVLVRPADMTEAPGALGAAADGSMALGAWIPWDGKEDLMIGGNVFGEERITAAALDADGIIAQLSEYMTLRMGDLIVAAMLPMRVPAERDRDVEISVNGAPSLKITIK